MSQADLFGSNLSRNPLQPSTEKIVTEAAELFARLAEVPIHERVAAINRIRLSLREYSAFCSEPVDCVQWVPSDLVRANDYNPNAVAPPEMRLLERSITKDGYTQPIVAWSVGKEYEVVDGFHRNRVGRECDSVRERVHGYLPLAVISSDREERGDRIAATIRHNRARGKHQVEAMSDIVLELKRRNWTDEKIGNELGMDPDEVLRLCQITGLAELFSDKEFSHSWDIDATTEPEAFTEFETQEDEA